MDEQQLNIIQKMAETMSQLNELLPDLKEMRDTYRAEKARREEEEKEIEQEKFTAQDFINRLKQIEKAEKEHRERIAPLLK